MAFHCLKFPKAQVIVDAYIAATGRPVSWTLQREIAAHRIVDAGYTPDDVRIVMQTIEFRVNKGLSGYTSMSLSFSNAIEKFERFEDLLLDVRAKLARRRTRAVVDVPHVRELPGGNTVTVLAPESAPEIAPISAEALAQLAECRRKIGGGQ